MHGATGRPEGVSLLQFFQDLASEGHIRVSSSPPEEHFDRVTSIYDSSTCTPLRAGPALEYH